jgi:hypothetical protein
MIEFQKDEPDLAILSIQAEGQVLVADAMELLKAVEDSYDAITAFLNLTSIVLREAETYSEEEIRVIAATNHNVIFDIYPISLYQVSLSSPGWWKFIGLDKAVKAVGAVWNKVKEVHAVYSNRDVKAAEANKLNAEAEAIRVQAQLDAEKTRRELAMKEQLVASEIERQQMEMGIKSNTSSIELAERIDKVLREAGASKKERRERLMITVIDESLIVRAIEKNGITEVVVAEAQQSTKARPSIEDFLDDEDSDTKKLSMGG